MNGTPLLCRPLLKPAQIRPAWATALLLPAALTLPACEDPANLEDGAAIRAADGELDYQDEAAPTCELEDADECEPAVYHHPLQGLEPIDGQLPFFDIHELPEEGVSYAIMEGGGQLSEDAPTSYFGGVVELDYRTLSDEEWTEHEAQKVPVPAPLPSGPTIAPAILAKAAKLDPSALVDHVFIEIHRPTAITGTVTDDFERAIAEGFVTTEADAQAVRADLLQERISVYESQAAPVAAEIEALGGKVTSICRLASCILASVPSDQLEALASHPLVERIDVGPADPVGGVINGVERAEAYDAELFWDQPLICGGSTRSFDGDLGCSQNVHVAVADTQEFLLDHVAFRSNSSSSSSRIKEAWECEPNCTTNVNFSNAGDHGTQTLGALLQDYRDGQQAGLSTTQQRERSATAGETKAYVYDYNGPGYGNALLNMVTRSPTPNLILESQADTDFTNTKTCLGETPADELANGVYEAGTPYFLLAGNNGGSATNCRVWDPSAAIGVFTVGGYRLLNGDACEVETAPANSSSSWGGATSGNYMAEGKGRSIIDVAGSYSHDNIANSASTTSLGPYTGTSAATPSVGSVAIGVIDMFKKHIGTNYIDNPGILYAWMLNMGDRATGTGGKISSRFDHRLGAGHLKARFLSNEGMDAPWSYYHYTVCVADGGVHSFSLNGGNKMPKDVDGFRAVAWWYDERHADGTTIDDIDLILRNGANGDYIKGSLDRHDNKERVYVADVGDLRLDLEVVGHSVTSDVAGCGNNRMKVFVTIIAEDSDRDDGNGPTYNSTTCEGVNTL